MTDLDQDLLMVVGSLIALTALIAAAAWLERWLTGQTKGRVTSSVSSTNPGQ